MPRPKKIVVNVESTDVDPTPPTIVVPVIEPSSVDEHRILEFLFEFINKKRKHPLTRDKVIEMILHPPIVKEKKPPKTPPVTKGMVCDYLLEKHDEDIDLIKAEIKKIPK
jgi:hypothetical protein